MSWTYQSQCSPNGVVCYFTSVLVACDLIQGVYVQGALELREKTVADIMTPVDSVFMLDIDTELDIDVLNEVGVL